MEHEDLDRRIDRVAALGDPVRRALYHHVAGQPDAVTRDEAATALGLARHNAKFHLDRLVTDGLLEAEYRRPPGRGGPGAGRPAKRYRAVGEVEVSLPERRYDLAGRLLVRAVAASARTGAPVADALDGIARTEGREVGAALEPGRRSPAHRVQDALAACGFEPSQDGPDLVLDNCPFHRLAEEERELVCTMNLAFVTGLLEGVGADGPAAALDPRPGGCCVRIRG